MFLSLLRQRRAFVRAINVRVAMQLSVIERINRFTPLRKRPFLFRPVVAGDGVVSMT